MGRRPTKKILSFEPNQQLLKELTTVENNPEEWLKLAIPEAFNRPFSSYHKEIVKIFIDCLEDKTSNKKTMLLIPRGGGKTTLLIGLITWAVLTKKMNFFVYLTADMRMSRMGIDLFTGFMTSTNLIQTYYPSYHMAFYNPNKMGKAYKKIDFIYTFSNSYVRMTGKGYAITGFFSGLGNPIRGLLQIHNGKVYRPELILIDDPQSRKTAYSPSLIEKRLETIKRDVIGLAGIDKPLSIFMLSTRIKSGDLVDQIEKSNEWKVLHYKAINKFPKNMELWREWYNIDLVDKEEARNFLIKNFEKMHEGAEVSWEHRKSQNDLSPLEWIMRLYHADPASFTSEYQNELPNTEVPPSSLTYEDLQTSQTNFNKFERRFSKEHSSIFLSIDTGSKRLWWVLGEVTPFHLHILSYGTLPELPMQSLSSYALDTLSLEEHNTLSSLFPDCDEGSRSIKGIEQIITFIKNNIDSLDGVIINAYQSNFNSILEWTNRRQGRCWLYNGRYSSPEHKFINYGHKIHAALGIKKDKTGLSYLQGDANYWKTRLADMIKRKYFTIHRGVHTLYFKSLLSEFPELRKNKVNEEYIIWTASLSIPNHWWDATYMLLVLAAQANIIDSRTLRVVSFKELADQAKIRKIDKKFI